MTAIREEGSECPKCGECAEQDVYNVSGLCDRCESSIAWSALAGQNRHLAARRKVLRALYRAALLARLERREDPWKNSGSANERLHPTERD